MTENEFIEAGRKWLEDDKLTRRVKHADRNRKFCESHPNYMKEYRDTHRESMNEGKKRYKRTEKGKANSQRYKAKRRSREETALNTLTFSEWTDILKEYDYRCIYCGIELDASNPPERDRIIPVSKGGDNTKENIVPSCRLCNAKKGDRIMIFELMRLRDRVERLSFRNRTDIDDEFLKGLPENTKLYQAYFMGKEEQATKETVTSDLLEVAPVLNDTERTCLLKISRRLLEEDNA